MEREKYEMKAPVKEEIGQTRTSRAPIMAMRGRGGKWTELEHALDKHIARYHGTY